MVKPNYGFIKRQKELKKKQKNEEKRLRKLNKSSSEGSDIEETNVFAPAEPQKEGTTI